MAHRAATIVNTAVKLSPSTNVSKFNFVALNAINANAIMVKYDGKDFHIDEFNYIKSALMLCSK